MRRRLRYTPEAFQDNEAASLWREPAAWVGALSGLALGLVTVVERYGSWRVLITEGYALPVLVIAGLGGVAGVARARSRQLR